MEYRIKKAAQIGPKVQKGGMELEKAMTEAPAGLWVAVRRWDGGAAMISTTKEGLEKVRSTLNLLVDELETWRWLTASQATERLGFETDETPL